VTSTSIKDDTAVAKRAESSKRPSGVFRRSLRLWRVRAGLLLVLIVAGICLLGPALAPHGETEFVGRPNTRVVDGLRFGTDYLGQDVWSRFLLGGRSILLYALIATGLGVTVGAAIGLVAALDRGLIDEILMRSVDVMLAIPQFLLVLVAMTSIGPKTWLIVAAVAVTTAPRVARVTRGVAIVVAQRDFVVASEALGESRWRIIRSDLLPNISGPLLVEANIRFAFSIAVVASLAFLGFVPSVNSANWGLMVQENGGALSVQPWAVVLPTLAIIAVTIGTGLIADGIARTSAGIDRA
jgi:peptide/nickel transport system permease protein